MNRQIVVGTGTLARLLRAFNRRTCFTPLESLADSRTQDVDDLIADQAHDLEEEQRRLHEERRIAMRDGVDRRMRRPTDVPSQLVGDAIRMRSTGTLQLAPTGSGDRFRPPSPPTGMHHSAPTGSGDLLRPPSPPPFQSLLFTRTELEQVRDEFLNIEMLFRSVPSSEETTREDKVRHILRHQKP